MSEIAQKAKFDYLRYAQVWEDAEVLIKALDIHENGTYLSIASAGDNAFAILSQNPKAVIALDLNPVQLYSVELRVRMYEHLSYSEFLELYGVKKEGQNRAQLYAKLRAFLTPECRKFWDEHTSEIAAGIASGGKFERYFALFRNYALRFVHSQKNIDALLVSKTQEDRELFYETVWNSWRWKLMFRLFFSKKMMGKFGRDKAFFKYTKGNISGGILERTKHALTKLDTSKNAYLHWILKGEFGEILPVALRKENFETIKKNLHKFSWKLDTIENYLATTPTQISGFNLSDIFEYMDEEQYHQLLEKLHNSGEKGARLAYWNMRVLRKAPEHMMDKLHLLETLSTTLHEEDCAFFYRDFVIEEVL
jgi:S-adenosylmethionine-diacylglycerol 3-amino-3-carboxypropyl transferase